MTHYQDGKNKDALLADIRGGSEPGSKAFEQTKAAITVECARDIQRALESLQSSIVQSSSVSDRLGNRVFWLNVVLTIATIVIAIGTCIMAFK